MRDYETLVVWERAHAWTVEVYEASAGFPRDERYGLTSQLRRAALSVPTNIAEGCGRPGPGDFARLVGYAGGSVTEADYLLRLATDLGYLRPTDAAALRAEAGHLRRMLAALYRALKQRARP